MEEKKTFWDKNGVEIKAGDIIYNEHDAKKYYDVEENEKGELCFIDGELLHERYAFNRFWEVVTDK